MAKETEDILDVEKDTNTSKPNSDREELSSEERKSEGIQPIELKKGDKAVAIVMLVVVVLLLAFLLLWSSAQEKTPKDKFLETDPVETTVTTVAPETEQSTMGTPKEFIVRPADAEMDD